MPNEKLKTKIIARITFNFCANKFQRFANWTIKVTRPRIIARVQPLSACIKGRQGAVIGFKKKGWKKRIRVLTKKTKGIDSDRIGTHTTLHSSSEFTFPLHSFIRSRLCSLIYACVCAYATSITHRIYRVIQNFGNSLYRRNSSQKSTSNLTFKKLKVLGTLKKIDSFLTKLVLDTTK